jgi:hypothetical protein
MLYKSQIICSASKTDHALGEPFGAGTEGKTSCVRLRILRLPNRKSSVMMSVARRAGGLSRQASALA